MTERRGHSSAPRTKKRNVVLMERDLTTLFEIFVHRTITSIQLAKLGFHDVSYETARKRIRRLQQAGFIGSATSGRMEYSRGRPENIYFLTPLGAKALEQYRGISWNEIPTGMPHSYHKEHFLRLVDIRLLLMQAQLDGIITHFEFRTGREFWRELTKEEAIGSENADATITFQYNASQPEITVLLEMDTGNFRQTKHWEPKINSFLKTGLPIWVITGSAPRISKLQQWTQPLLEAGGAGAGKCVFAIFEDLMSAGFFGAVWQRTDGSITDLKPKTGTLT
ncbi:MAG: replication-relaxation family protein [Cyanobacteria bacterium TGS_CYA1]|nr:replication-relaxation family protein [Cyanobacteria bacterium TGS_CYA1]